MRVTVNLKHLEEFCQFLQARGAESWVTNGAYEIRRLTMKGLEQPILIFRREGKDVLTVSMNAGHLVEQFYHEKKNPGKKGDPTLTAKTSMDLTGKSPEQLVAIIGNLEKTCKMQEEAAARTMASVKVEKSKAFDEGAKAKEDAVFWYRPVLTYRQVGDLCEIRFSELKNPYRKEG